MRIPALIVTVMLLASACGSTPDVVTTGAGNSDRDGTEVSTPFTEAASATAVPSATPVETDSPPEPTVEPTAVPGTRPAVDPADLLLTGDYLPGWEVSAPVLYEAESPFVAGDCPLMNTAWAAHGEPGTGVEATGDGVVVSQAMVEMVSPDRAIAVLDAADAVWEECSLLSFGGGQWWSEPVGALEPDGWRSSVLALGNDDGATWIIGYWQRGSTSVIADMTGDQVWTHVQSLLVTIGARLEGTPAGEAPPRTPLPVEPPQIEPLPTVPTTGPIELPTPRGGPDDEFPPSWEDWPEHPLASLAPSPEDLGPGWTYDNGQVKVAEPSSPDDVIPECPIDPPPTLDGYELEYKFEHDSSLLVLDDALAIQIGGSDAVGAQAMVDAFRGLADCELSESDFVGGLDSVQQEVDGADDAVLLEGRADEVMAIAFYIGVARFDDLSILVFWAYMTDDGIVAPRPTSDDVATLIESIAARR